MLKILSQAERHRIHQVGKIILEVQGVKVNNRIIYDLLMQAGGVPDGKNPVIVHMPEKMVKKYLEKCPKQFTITNRNGESSIVKNGSRSLYFTSNAIQYARGNSRKVCEIGEKEFIELVRVVDKLENVDGHVGTSIKEYKPQFRDFSGFKLMAQYSYKHLRPCIYTPDGAEAIIEMSDVILDGKSLKENMFFTLGYSAVSPLTWSNTALELFFRTKGYCIPMMINSEPMAGGTSPVTLAGSLALADAEVISGIVINQVIEPGRPCIYNSGFAHVLDMMTTIVLTGAPENALLQAAGAEMAEFHGLPCASWCLSDAPMLDSQASYEKLFTMLAHTLSGVNMVWGIGNLETSKTISPEAAVIDNELIGNCLRFSKGITVDDEHLAFDVIREVSTNGSFLDTDHTFKFFREEIRNSNLPNRINRTLWEQQGSKSIEEKAENAVNNILNRKCDIYLNGTQLKRLEKIQEKWMGRG